MQRKTITYIQKHQKQDSGDSESVHHDQVTQWTLNTSALITEKEQIFLFHACLLLLSASSSSLPSHLLPSLWFLLGDPEESIAIGLTKVRSQSVAHNWHQPHKVFKTTRGQEGILGSRKFKFYFLNPWSSQSTFLCLIKTVSVKWL